MGTFPPGAVNPVLNQSAVMAIIEYVWPAEKNVGGIHRTGRYVLAPVLVTLGLAVLTGWLSVAPGLAGTIVGVAAVFAGVVSLVEAHTQKCPGYAVMGINTCELPETGSTPVGEEAA